MEWLKKKKLIDIGLRRFFNGFGNHVMDGFPDFGGSRTLDAEGSILVNQLETNINGSNSIRKSTIADFLKAAITYQLVGLR